MANFYVNMSTNLRRTKAYFLTIAIVSFMIIFISYNWNIPENIYKISSEISKVRISELHLNDIGIREQRLDVSLKGITGKLTKVSKQIGNETKDINNTKINLVDSTAFQGRKLNVDKLITRDSSQTLKIKEKFVHMQATNNQSTNTTNGLLNPVVTAGDPNLILNDNIGKNVLNRTNNTFEKIQNSKVETKEVLREIHRLKDEISSDHKSYVSRRNKQQNTRYQVLRKNNSNQFVTDRNFQAFQRVRNSLKQLGRGSINGLIMPLQNSFDNNIDSDVTSRPDVCTGCFERNFKKLIDEPTLCDSDVELLFMVASTFSRKDSRNAIRNTWCKQCNTLNSKMKLVFVFGNRNDTIENINLQAESSQYHDIIQLDFHDTYANLTYKTISSLQWSEDYCKKANFVMKTDDDMYVNTELLPLLLKAAPSKNLIGGMCWGPSPPHRDLNSKWYVSFVQYRHSLFPSMCSGTGYVMSRDVVSGILEESPNVPFFYLEDVYVAICVKRLGVTPLLLDGFKNQRVDFEPCVYRNSIITAHELNADTLIDIWEQSRACPKEDLRPEMVYKPVPV